MRRRSLFLAVVGLLMAGFAGAELSQSFKDWPSSPAGYLLTKDERKAYEKIQADAEAKAFIDLFWAKRDPDLNTPVNEFKLDFDQRVAAADKMFGTEKIPGSMTDRGRTLIIMGRPNHVANLPAGSVQGPGLGEGGGPTMEERGATEVWEYRDEKLPKGVKATQVYFVFVESRVGTNDFVLDRTDRRNILAMKLLADAPETSLLHPKLTEVPKPPYLPGAKAPTSQQLAVFSSPTKPWPQGARVFAVEGMQSEAMQPLWVYLELPSAVAPASEAIGRVRAAADGREIGSFVIPVKPNAVHDGNAYEFSLPVAAGTYSVDIALLDASGPLAVTNIDATSEAPPADGPYISPFYWGVDVRQDAQAHLGDPFDVGGWHILPRLSNTYSPTESLAYFCYVLRPSMEEPAAPADSQAPKPEAKPAMTVSMALFMGDKKLNERPPEAANLSHVYNDLWMFGSGLPLHIFRKSGEFRLEITLTDSKTKVSRTVKIPLMVNVGPPPATPAPAAAPSGGVNP
ncbi:MAG: GWxTD domain-containing protein [Acidobacteriota bacterium]